MVKDPAPVRIQYPVPPHGWKRFNPVSILRYLKHVDQFILTLSMTGNSWKGSPPNRVMLSSERQMLEGWTTYEDTQETKKRREAMLRRHCGR